MGWAGSGGTRVGHGRVYTARRCTALDPVTALEVIALVTALALAVYLVVALLLPDRFL
jgi:K+-transporting ATPase KdpF subunit